MSDDTSDVIQPISPEAAAAELMKQLPASVAAPAATPEKSARQLPKKIGEYDVISEINRGGMGIVYKAVDPQLRRLVAIKVLLAGEGATDEDIIRFQREAQATARLQHTNIVPIYGVGTYEGKPYLVMDFVQGKTAKQLKDDGKMTPRLALTIIEGVAEALHHAHQHGVIHRDVKPANILVDKDERVQLMDFGLARRVDEDLEITQSGTTMGTPSYMAPEQAEGKLTLVDGQSDVYSAGACLYELITGRVPFEAETVMLTLQKILEDLPVAPRKINPKIHRDVETICLKCLEKPKKNRYGNARQLAEDIRRFNAGEAIVAKPLGAFAMLVRRAWMHKEVTIAVMVALLSILAATAYSVNEARWVARQKKFDREQTLRDTISASQRALENVRDSLTMLRGASAGDFQQRAEQSRTLVGKASIVARQAEAIAPDNGEVRQSLDQLKKLENALEVQRFIFKAQMFLYPPPGRPEDPPVTPNFAGAEFAAQEAVDRDPENKEARALLRQAAGFRPVSIQSAPTGADVYARRILDGVGRQLATETGKGKRIGTTPLQDLVMEPGLYVLTVQNVACEPQQNTLLVSRESKEEDLLLHVQLSAHPENMVQFKEGEVTLPQIGPARLPAFAIDRFEFPNKAGVLPTTNVSLLEAKNLCKEQGKSLCSSAQWLRACMGDDERRYPYGKAYISRSCAAGLDGDLQTRPLMSGQFTRCRTAEGVYDMSGNVGEWTDSDQEDSIFGGDWTSSARFADLTVSCISRSLPEQTTRERVGFRCCKSKP